MGKSIRLNIETLEYRWVPSATGLVSVMDAVPALIPVDALSSEVSGTVDESGPQSGLAHLVPGVDLAQELHIAIEGPAASGLVVTSSPGGGLVGNLEANLAAFGSLTNSVILGGAESGLGAKLALSTPLIEADINGQVGSLVDAGLAVKADALASVDTGLSISPGSGVSVDGDISTPIIDMDADVAVDDGAISGGVDVGGPGDDGVEIELPPLPGEGPGGAPGGGLPGQGVAPGAIVSASGVNFVVIFNDDDSLNLETASSFLTQGASAEAEASASEEEANALTAGTLVEPDDAALAAAVHMTNGAAVAPEIEAPLEMAAADEAFASAEVASGLSQPAAGSGQGNDDAFQAMLNDLAFAVQSLAVSLMHLGPAAWLFMSLAMAATAYESLRRLQRTRQAALAESRDSWYPKLGIVPHDA